MAVRKKKPLKIDRVEVRKAVNVNFCSFKLSKDAWPRLSFIKARLGFNERFIFSTFSHIEQRQRPKGRREKVERCLQPVFSGSLTTGSLSLWKISAYLSLFSLQPVQLGIIFCLDRFINFPISEGHVLNETLVVGKVWEGKSNRSV